MPSLPDATPSLFAALLAQSSFGSYQNELNQELPWIIGGALALYIAFTVGAKIFKARRRGLGDAPDLDFGRLRKTGLLTPEELKAVQRKMVGGVAEGLLQRPGAPREGIDAAVGVGAENIGSYLTPEEIAASERARQLREEVERRGGATQFDKYLDPALKAKREGKPDGAPAPAELASASENADESAPEPAKASPEPVEEPKPAVPRVSPDSPEARLDDMLAAGVINAKEHAEMKAHYERKRRG